VHLLNIAIAPAFQRRALALNTLKELIRDYQQRQMRFLYLEVRASNVAAQALYQRLGFVISGERKNYYLVGSGTNAGRESAILMTLELSLHG
jgi:ribosomal-protein-alanine N-acetyltransferase